MKLSEMIKELQSLQVDDGPDYKVRILAEEDDDYIEAPITKISLDQSPRFGSHVLIQGERK